MISCSIKYLTDDIENNVEWENDSSLIMGTNRPHVHECEQIYQTYSPSHRIFTLVIIIPSLLCIWLLTIFIYDIYTNGANGQRLSIRIRRRHRCCCSKRYSILCIQV